MCPFLTLHKLLLSLLQMRLDSSFATSLLVTDSALLQSVLCIAARVFFLNCKLDYVTLQPEILQRLPTALRIKFKLLKVASRSGSSCLPRHISNHFPLHFNASVILINIRYPKPYSLQLSGFCNNPSTQNLLLHSQFLLISQIWSIVFSRNYFLTHHHHQVGLCAHCNIYTIMVAFIHPSHPACELT